MGSEESFSKWIKFSEKRGFKKSFYHPPIDSVLKFLKIRCRPIIFWNPWLAGLFMGLYFSFAIGFILFFPIWTLQGTEFKSVAFYSISAGFVFGCYISFRNYLFRKKENLPDWKEFEKP